MARGTRAFAQVGLVAATCASLRALAYPCTRSMNLLSIQSHVAYGHVGNAAAIFALQRIGVEVWPVHTVQFSNHTGYGRWRGRVFDGEAIGDVVQGMAELGVLGACDGVISGYVGDPGIGRAILDAVARVRAANPAARYCCDPVIGDVGRGVFVREGVGEFMREQAVPAADIVTPNQFELEYLSGRSSTTMHQALGAIDAVHARGPRVVLVTSVHTDETPADAIDLVASDGRDRFRVRTPKLQLTVNGAGDAIAALFFAHMLRTGSVARALSAATSSVFGVLHVTLATGAGELALIAAQDQLVEPREVFEAERL
jgi:pyridoxine kinase